MASTRGEREDDYKNGNQGQFFKVKLGWNQRGGESESLEIWVMTFMDDPKCNGFCICDTYVVTRLEKWRKQRLTNELDSMKAFDL